MLSNNQCDNRVVDPKSGIESMGACQLEGGQSSGNQNLILLNGAVN